MALPSTHFPSSGWGSASVVMGAHPLAAYDPEAMAGVWSSSSLSIHRSTSTSAASVDLRPFAF
ncbi:MAG: hypothetical protein M3Y49_04525 [Actinomycetota bacterium]|nr:hypothetical protein [Actinomycetota bacterium]